ncbi:MAG: hypothetical protein ABI599_13220 [Flavobacteriales bacterium]
MERISERVSVERSKDLITVVISARLPRAKEGLLMAWVLMWTACGAVFIHQFATLPNGSMRAFMLGMSAVWLFYELRIGRTLLWRMKGFEFWRVKDGVLTIKDSIFGYGKARDWFVTNIRDLGVLAMDRSDWRMQFTDSFWTMAGERLGFSHLEKRVAFGKGLTDDEATALVRILKDRFAQERKAAQ